MPNTENQTELEIQSKGLDAPRLAPNNIDAKIKSEEFHLLPHNITVCILVLENGYKVTGLNHASVSPENFDAEMGRNLAYQDARRKIWELEGYLLKENLYQAQLDSQF
ncbi:Gp49 family protein [Acinetobacter baumannii]